MLQQPEQIYDNNLNNQQETFKNKSSSVLKKNSQIQLIEKQNELPNREQQLNNINLLYLKKQKIMIDSNSQTLLNRITKMDNEQLKILKKIEQTRNQAQKIIEINQNNNERFNLLQEESQKAEEEKRRKQIQILIERKQRNKILEQRKIEKLAQLSEYAKNKHVLSQDLTILKYQMKLEEEEYNRIQKQKIKTSEEKVILKNMLELEKKKKYGQDRYNQNVQQLNQIIQQKTNGLNKLAEIEKACLNNLQNTQVQQKQINVMFENAVQTTIGSHNDRLNQKIKKNIEIRKSYKMPPEFDHIIEALEKNPELIEKNDLISQEYVSILSGSPRSPFIKKGRTPVVADASSYKSLNYTQIKAQTIPEPINSVSVNQNRKFKNDIIQNEEPYNDQTIQIQVQKESSQSLSKRQSQSLDLTDEKDTTDDNNQQIMNRFRGGRSKYQIQQSEQKLNSEQFLKKLQLNSQVIYPITKKQDFRSIEPKAASEQNRFFQNKFETESQQKELNDTYSESQYPKQKYNFQKYFHDAVTKETQKQKRKRLKKMSKNSSLAALFIYQNADLNFYQELPKLKNEKYCFNEFFRKQQLKIDQIQNQYGLQAVNPNKISFPNMKMFEINQTQKKNKKNYNLELNQINKSIQFKKTSEFNKDEQSSREIIKDN